MPAPVILDCTLRDGGYYNAWNFPINLITKYLASMDAAGVDVVELGFRFTKNEGFKGACAFTSDDFIRSLEVPENLRVSVMVNAADLINSAHLEATLHTLFPEGASSSPVDVVRLACHFHEVQEIEAAVQWLSNSGFDVGLNLMQISDRSLDEISQVARMAESWPVRVLYFADSLGSLTPETTSEIVDCIRGLWSGAIGVHTHDNMGLALPNTLSARKAGATWLDATVTGMGRGPGNARSEELVIELAADQGSEPNLVPLLELIRMYFRPMKEKYGWGTNPFYFLAGRNSIHPSFIQEMLQDNRYSDDDIIAVIGHLKKQGGKKFSFNQLDAARDFYTGPPRGTWNPRERFDGREVLILGTGPSVSEHRKALEAFICREAPVVLALNAKCDVESEMIDLRIACHPVRLVADAATHAELPQSLITPASMLPGTLKRALSQKDLLDFGLSAKRERFEFHDTFCIVPNSLVLAYALAAVTSGHSKTILMAGFDGYPAGDPRNEEVELMLEIYSRTAAKKDITSVTPTTYKNLPSCSVYGL